jgi:hypothetical protein
MSRAQMALARFNYAAVAVVTAMMVFNAVVRYAKLDPLMYAATGLVVAVNVFGLMLRPSLLRGVVWVLPFVLLGLIPFAWTALTSSVLIAIAGLVGGYAYLAFWTLPMARPEFGVRHDFLRWYARLHVWFGFITAVVAIYQFYISPELHGILPPRYYTHEEFLAQGFTKRATSFIGSPQNLGVYLGLVLGCLPLVPMKRWVMIGLAAVMIWGGLVSGSAAFAACLVLLFIGYCWNARRVPAMVLRASLAVPLLVFLVAVQSIENLESTPFAVLYMGNPLEDRLPLYTSLMEYEDPYTTLFGHGLGTATRVTEVLLGEGATPRDWKTSESYLATIWHETGLVGFGAFVLIYVVALIRAARRPGLEGRLLVGILFAIVGNLVATPAFTGLTMACIVWPFILYPLFAPDVDLDRVEALHA